MRHEVRWQPIIPLALGTLTLALLISFLGQWGNDDPYITFRYARNLLDGQGFVYNIGERTLSTTAPGYALLLAGFGLIWTDLPALSSTLSAVALVSSAAILICWSRSRQQPIVGMIAALMIVFSPSLLATIGAETCLYVMLVLAGFYAYDESRLNLAASALAIAATVRPDGILAAAALGLYHLVRYRKVVWQPIILYAGLVGVWYVGLWLYYGSPLPITLLAKQQQAQLAASARFEVQFWNLIRQYSRQPLFWLQGILAVVGLVQVATKARHWSPLLVWTALYFLAFSILGVSSYPWYYSPLVPAWAVLVAEGTAKLARVLAQTRLPRLLALGATGVLIIAVLAPLIGGALGTVWTPDPRLEVYTEIGNWLDAHTPAEASVGLLEIGIIGYYSNRPVVGFAGLLEPDVARQLTATTGYLDSGVWAIQTYQPDYVVLPQPDFLYVTEEEWFQEAYLPIRNFDNQDKLWLTLYQRSEG